MGYALMWIETLAAALLLLAVVTACAAHWKRRWRQVVAPILAAFLLAALAAASTAGLFFLDLGSLDAFPFGYALGWTIAFTVGAAVLLFRGLKQPAAPAVPAARAWPRARLAVVLAALLVVDCITFTNLDLAIKLQMASDRAEFAVMRLTMAPPRVSDHDNAAPIYRQAFAAWTPVEKLTPEQQDRWFANRDAFGEPDDGPGKGGFGHPTFDPKGKDLRKFLDSQRRALALLRRAAAMPGCWFEHNAVPSFDVLLPDLQHLRHAGRLLALEAVSRAANGDGRGALEDVAGIFRIARHIQGPALICLLSAWGIEKDGGRALEDVLALAAFRPEDLARLAFAAEPPYRRDLQRDLRMAEAAFGSTPIVVPAFYRVFFLKRDLNAYHRTIGEYYQLAGHPYYETHKNAEAFDRSFAATRKGVLGGLLLGLLKPAIDQCITAAAEAEARYGLCQAALAATAYQLRKGKFPDKLEDLIPDDLARIPIDPFDGKPLRMKREGKDLLLYSVGLDGEDNGGVPWNPATKKGDLVFRLRGR